MKFKESTLYCIQTVSYTHLDVYKRQRTTIAAPTVSERDHCDQFDQCVSSLYLRKVQKYKVQ